MPRNLGIKPNGLEDATEFPRVAGALTVQRIRETWQVLGDFPGQDSAAIKATSGLPRQGDTRGVMGVKSIAAREVDAQAALWEVDVDWDSRVDGENQGDDPTLWRPQVEWDYEEIEVQIQIDQVTGDLIANAVGEKFLDVTTPVPVAVRSYTRYEPYDIVDYYDDLQVAWSGRCNSHPFRGWPPYTVKLAGIRAREEPIDRTRYARVTYITKHLPLIDVQKVVIRNAPDEPGDGLPPPKLTFEVVGWRRSLLNEGTFYWESAEAAPKVPRQFMNENGRPTRGNLRRNGEQLADGEDAVYLRFHPYRAKNLNELQI